MDAFWGNLGGGDGESMVKSPTFFLLTISNLLFSQNLGRTEDFLKNMSLNLLNHQFPFYIHFELMAMDKKFPFFN